jgi:hypothetical protein
MNSAVWRGERLVASAIARSQVARSSDHQARMATSTGASQ